MGDKVDGFRAKLKAMPDGDPIQALGNQIGHALQLQHRPSDVFAMADGIMHLKSLKAMVDSAAKAVNEQIEFRSNELYQLMLAEEMQNFSRKGQSFYQTTNTYVKAKDELGGRSNPDLRAWLDEAGMGNIVKQDINYQTLQGSINEWLANNPIEVVRNGDFLEGDEMLEALGIDAEEFAHRKAMHEQLRQLVDIGETHTVGMRKA